MPVSASARTRDALGHPVIDADAHLLEFEPLYHDYIRREGGASALAAFHGLADRFATWYRADSERRQRERIQRPAFGLPTRNALDLATAMVPRLLYQRLDAMGIDYMVVNPTTSLACIKLPDEALRRTLARAINRCHADLFRDLSDRMTVAALIPTVTPAEAIDELEFAVGELGFKVACIDHAVRRTLTAPIHTYAHTGDPNRRCSITGGYVYRGTCMPDMQGRYLFADYCSAEVFHFVRSGDTANDLVNAFDLGENLTSFGEDATGEVYITQLDGALYRLTTAP